MKKLIVKLLDFITNGRYTKLYKLAYRIGKSQHEWAEENLPYGKKLGYPDCCIREFCLQSPYVLKLTNRTQSDIDRYHASLINDVFSGFIPCKKHAKQILAGKITLASLIKDRDVSLPPFPNQW